MRRADRRVVRDLLGEEAALSLFFDFAVTRITRDGVKVKLKGLAEDRVERLPGALVGAEGPQAEARDPCDAD